jgi:tRNA A-37 threonylcarbamoyl transferase component Bud32
MNSATLVHLAPGTVFAHDFRVVRPLAEGGMGAVYIVEQLSTGKERALKVMHPQLVADPAHRARFAQEARMGSRIESDHVVEVLAAGIDEPSQNPWIAMELLRGEDLAARLEGRGPLTSREALDVMKQLGHALAAAHRAGLVHRDIKPENIFLAQSRREGEAYVVKVLDFGIAKVMHDARVAATSTGAMGSPSWMAPEQTELRGKIGPPTDVWALGLVAFCMFTARIFWMAQNTPDASLQALMREMLFDPLPPPSARAAQLGVGATFPEGFDAWFARCVARDPAARFEDAGKAVAAFVALFGQGVHGASTAVNVAGNVPVVASQVAAPGAVRTPTEPLAGGSAPQIPTIVGGPISTAPPQAPSTLIWNPSQNPVPGVAPGVPMRPLQPTVPQPVPSSRGSRSLVLGSVAVGLLLVAGVVGIAFMVRKREPEPNENAPVPTVVPTVTPTEPVTPPPAPTVSADVPVAPPVAVDPTPAQPAPTTPVAPRPTRPTTPVRPTVPRDAATPATTPTTPPEQTPTPPPTPPTAADSGTAAPPIPIGRFPGVLQPLLNMTPQQREQRIQQLQQLLQQSQDPAQRARLQQQIERLQRPQPTP